jgi:hypothetical protein
MNDLFDDSRRYRLDSTRVSRIDIMFGWILAAVALVALVGLAML